MRLDATASRRMLAAGVILALVVLALLALLGFPPPAAAAKKIKAPSTTTVTTRLRAAITTALWDYGLLVDAGVVTVGCRPGTRGDATRRVRWFCIALERDSLGEIVYRSRLRVRAQRGSMRTALDWRGWGRVRLDRDWYIDTGRLL